MAKSGLLCTGSGLVSRYQAQDQPESLGTVIVKNQSTQGGPSVPRVGGGGLSALPGAAGSLQECGYTIGLSGRCLQESGRGSSAVAGSFDSHAPHRLTQSPGCLPPHKGINLLQRNPHKNQAWVSGRKSSRKRIRYLPAWCQSLPPGSHEKSVWDAAIPIVQRNILRPGSAVRSTQLRVHQEAGQKLPMTEPTVQTQPACLARPR